MDREREGRERERCTRKTTHIFASSFSSFSSFLFFSLLTEFFSFFVFFFLAPSLSLSLSLSLSFFLFLFLLQNFTQFHFPFLVLIPQFLRYFPFRSQTAIIPLPSPANFLASSSSFRPLFHLPSSFLLSCTHSLHANLHRIGLDGAFQKLPPPTLPPPRNNWAKLFINRIAIRHYLCVSWAPRPPSQFCSDPTDTTFGLFVDS